MPRLDRNAVAGGVFGLNGFAQPKEGRLRRRNVWADACWTTLDTSLIPILAQLEWQLAIDFPPITLNNFNMSTETTTDLELVCAALAEGRKVDLTVVQRIQATAEKIRDDVFQRQGLVSVSELTARE